MTEIVTDHRDETGGPTYAEERDEKFEDKLARGEFTFALKPGPRVGDKPTYQIDSALDIAFPAKQAADVVKRADLIELPSRNSIVRALKTALEGKYPHAVYEIDVKEFFGPVPHSTLHERLTRFPKLDSVTLRLVKRLLTESEAIQCSSVGLPRGVGLSSHRAELYIPRVRGPLRSYGAGPHYMASHMTETHLPYRVLTSRGNKPVSRQ